MSSTKKLITTMEREEEKWEYNPFYDSYNPAYQEPIEISFSQFGGEIASALLRC